MYSMIALLNITYKAVLQGYIKLRKRVQFPLPNNNFFAVYTDVCTTITHMVLGRSHEINWQVSVKPTYINATFYSKSKTAR